MISSRRTNCIHTTILVNQDAIILAWNPLLTDVWGYSAVEVVGKPLVFLFSENQKEEIEKDILHEIDISKKERTAIRKDGLLFQLFLSISSLYNERDELYSIVVQVAIGEMKSAVVTDTVSDDNKLIPPKNGYCIWHWNLITNHVTRGEGYGEIFGYHKPNINKGIKEWETLIHPNDRQRVIDNLALAIQDNVANWTDQYLFLKADGDYTFVLDKGTIIRNENGKAIQMIGAMHDHTREKFEEEQLRLFQSIIETVNDCIVVTEAEPVNGEFPKVVYVNAAFTRMTGYSKEEVIGKTPRILQGPGSSRSELDKVRKALENWEPCEVEVLNYRKNGETFWNNFSISPLANENGWYTHWISVQREVTNRKNAEKDLKQKNHELQELSAYLQTVREDERRYIAREVHEEMGQLVTALKIDVDWLQIKFAPEDEATGLHFTHAIKTMEILISSIRKMASSLRPSILDDFGLNTALEWQCRESQKIYGVVCEFISDFDDTILPVKITSGLFRIGEEALKNAMLHSKAKLVNLTVSAKENVLYVSVTDNGKGFTTSEKISSFGLMSLRERALSMGGKLTINSEPGKGTTVIASIPL